MQAYDHILIFKIGISGLEDLEKLDVRFCSFRDSLFSLSSKQFERAVQTLEVNKKVDEEIEKFLILLSPYFTLRSSHKALEWLVNRYHVHQFNVDAWIMCVLPFHDTKIFVRAVQVLNLKSRFNQWHWLKVIQRTGVPLSRVSLIRNCSKDLGLLRLICNNLEKALQVHSEKPTVLNVFIAFYATSIIGILEQNNSITEEQLTILLPTLLNGLVSKFPDLKAACYMIVAQLTRKAMLLSTAAEDFATAILKVRE